MVLLLVMCAEDKGEISFLGDTRQSLDIMIVGLEFGDVSSLEFGFR